MGIRSVFLTIAILFLNSCYAIMGLHDMQKEYLSFETEIAGDIKNASKKLEDNYIVIDGYHIGKRKLPILKEGKNQKEIWYDEYIIPGLLEGKDRTLQIFFAHNSANSVYKNVTQETAYKDGLTRKSKKGDLYQQLPQGFCENNIPNKIGIQSVYEKNFRIAKRNLLFSRNNKMGYFNPLVKIYETPDIPRKILNKYKKIKFILMDKQPQEMNSFLKIGGVNTIENGVNNKKKILFYDAVIRYHQNKYFSEYFKGFDKEVIVMSFYNSKPLMYNNVRYFNILRGNINNNWECYQSTALQNSVKYVNRNKKGVKRRNRVLLPLFIDIVTLPISFPAKLIESYIKIEKDKEFSEFLKDEVMYEYTQYINQNKKED